jgi:nucleoside-diphosphate-sugar epimerase
MMKWTEDTVLEVICMKVLMIGGTGTISTSITRLLLEQDIELTLYNRGKHPAKHPGRWKHIRGDRKDYPRFEDRMREGEKYDCVIDMFCFSPEDAESCARAFKGRIGQLIFCSTVDVYAKPASRYPITEAEPRLGKYPYASNKIKCEDILLDAHERREMAVTIIRPAHTYCEEGRILFSLGNTDSQLHRMRNGKPLVVHGDGTTFWVSCHADDVAGAFVNAVGNGRAYGKAYHAAGEEWLTWNRRYEIAAQVLGVSDLRLVHIPTDVLARISPQLSRSTVQNFSGHNIFDNAAAREDLGFRYTIPWEQGVRQIIDWLDRNGAAPDEAIDAAEDRIITAWEKHTADMATLADIG